MFQFVFKLILPSSVFVAVSLQSDFMTQKKYSLMFQLHHFSDTYLILTSNLPNKYNWVCMWHLAVTYLVSAGYSPCKYLVQTWSLPGVYQIFFMYILSIYMIHTYVPINTRYLVPPRTYIYAFNWYLLYTCVPSKYLVSNRYVHGMYWVLIYYLPYTYSILTWYCVWGTY